MYKEVRITPEGIVEITDYSGTYQAGYGTKKQQEEVLRWEPKVLAGLIRKAESMGVDKTYAAALGIAVVAYQKLCCFLPQQALENYDDFSRATEFFPGLMFSAVDRSRLLWDSGLRIVNAGITDGRRILDQWGVRPIEINDDMRAC